MKQFLTIFALFSALFVRAQTFEVGNNKYFINGDIKAIIKDNAGNTYIGGYFNRITTWSGSFAAINATTGQPESIFPRVAGGSVLSVVQIPSGGWYIGGTFTSINGVVRNKLARVNADGSVHPFNPNIRDGGVTAIVLDSNGNLYVGGSFSAVGDASTIRNGLCKFDNVGNLTAFNPNIGGGSVNALLLKASELYVGGSFTTVNATITRNRLCKFDNVGNLTAFDPDMNDQVNALALDSYENLYVGGDFTTVGWNSSPIKRLCKFNNSDNLSNFSHDINSSVLTLALDSNDNLYAGGRYTMVDNQAQKFLSKFDNTGALTAFNPDMGSSVLALAINGNGSVYAGGDFGTVGGTTPREGLCEFDSTGTLTAFNPGIISGRVRTLAVSGSTVIIGGSFAAIGSATVRNNLCKFDSAGVLTPFDPNMNFAVTALALNSAGYLYAAGGFTTVGSNNTARKFLCQFDTGGYLTGFDAQIVEVEPSVGFVNAIAVNSNNDLYVGGLFSGAGGATRNNLCKFDNAGSLTTFNPNVNGDVSVLAIDGSGGVYVGGSFNMVGITTRNKLCKFTSSGILAALNPDINGNVYAIKVDANRNMYVGGSFTMVGSVPRNYFCKIDNTGALNAFDANLNNIAAALTLDIDGSLYIGGNFTTVGNVPRNYLCKFNSTGTLTNFNPNINNNVSFLTSDSNGNLYVGGDFTTPKSYFTVFTYSPDCTSPATYALTQTGDYCIASLGLTVGLSNSETGVTYQLKRDGSNHGVLVVGTTGSPISFGTQPIGTYTVVATRTSGGCTATMSGSVVVAENVNISLSGDISQYGDARGFTTVSLTAIPTPAVGISYQWSSGNSPTTATNTFTTLGTYIVTVTMNTGVCSASKSIYVTVKLPCSLGALTILYVNAAATTSGDGSSFAQAFTSLGDALTLAYTCENIREIRVAAGTYKPNRKPLDRYGVEIITTDPRDRTFQIPGSVRVYGGYDANTGTRTGGASILSGDFNGDDVLTIPTTNNEENAYHVVFNASAQGGITLDGFTITGGNADNTTNNNFFNDGIANVYRSDGGGIYLSGNNGLSTLSNNIVSNNSAARNGGGIYVYFPNGSSSVENTTFYNNAAGQDGGAAYTKNAYFNRNTLYSNSAVRNGGGIYSLGLAGSMGNNALYGNTAANNGGGVYLRNIGNSTMRNNTFYNNSVAVSGGAVYSDSSKNSLINNIFWENKRGSYSNDYGYYAGTNIFTNNLLQLPDSYYTFIALPGYTPSTTNVGNIFGADPRFFNAADPDGADNIHRTADDGLTFGCFSPAFNSGEVSFPITDIVGTQDQFGRKDIGAYESTIDYSLPTLSVVGNTTGNGSVLLTANTTPSLAAGASFLWSSGNTPNTAANTFTTVGTYTVTVTVTSAGGCSTTTTVTPIIVHPSCPAGNTLYVDAAVSTSGDGSSFAQALSSLDQALYIAHRCNTITHIKVARGTYKPTQKSYDANGLNLVTTNPRDATFHVRSGLTLEGGYNAATGARIYGTSILSGDLYGNDIIQSYSGDTLSITNNTENVYHVVLLSAALSDTISTKIDGFTITGGNADNHYSTTTNGPNASSGGGVVMYGGRNTLTNNTLSHNNAVQGGALYNYGGTNTISNNTFSKNLSNDGAGILIRNGKNILTNNTFWRNCARLGYGGAISAYGSDTTTLRNNTFAFNSATQGGGAVYNFDDYYSPIVTIINNIFWGNTVRNVYTTQQGIDYMNSASISTSNFTFQNNLLQLPSSNYSTGGSFGIGANASGNIFAQNPLFLNPTDIDGPDDIQGNADDGLRILSGSPCDNIGVTLNAPTVDITGASRAGGMDIGAYNDFNICAGAAAILYVNANSTTSGDGSTWANAKKTLDEALVVAHRCPNVTTIKVAVGIYKPTRKPFNQGVEMVTTDLRDATFHVRGGLRLEGGYDAVTGTRTAESKSKLSGDLNGGDFLHVGGGFGGSGGFSLIGYDENVYHLLLVSIPPNTSSTVIIDGFIIGEGNANGLGAINVNGNTIERSNGGGAYICGDLYNAKDSLMNNTFTANTCTSNGAALFTYNATNMVIKNTIEYNKTTNGYGGGICSTGGVIWIERNTIHYNSAYNFGGGICVIQGATLLMSSNVLYNNSADIGGGIYVDSPLLSNPPLIISNTLYNNTANNGGGMLLQGEAASVKGNLFWVNKKAGNPNIQGADFISFTNPSHTFQNNLLQLASSNYTTMGSGQYDLGTGSANNLFAQDPLFVDAADPDGIDNKHRTTDDGLALRPGSPCIGTGTAPIVSLLDITGASRTGAAMDIGAYRYDNPCSSGTTLHVNASVSGGTGDGTSWANAYANLSSALAKAHTCSNITLVKVATGTYKPTKKPFNAGVEITTTDAKDITFHIPDGVTIQGGYDAATGSRNITANVTTLSGDITGNDVVSGSGATLSITNNTENAYHVVIASAASTGGVGVTIDGFTIKGGNANATSTITVNGNSVDRDYGGGIYTYYGTNTLSNNTLSGNNATYYGGGIYTSRGTNTLSNNTLSGNYTSNGGGGIYTDSGTNTMSNNTLSGNNATYYGGGIRTNFGTNTLSNNTLSGNTATNNGGGIYTEYGTDMLSNNIFWENKKGTANNIQGADYYASGTNGNTFKNNLLQLAASNYPVLATGNYAIGTAATGNLFAVNPLFVNAADVDGADNIHRTADDGLRLACNSPAYNTGTNTGAPALDILGNSIYATTKDMGAYESQIDIALPTATITGTTSGTGSVSLTASGGTAYAWSGGSPANTASNTFTSSGTYTVTVTNAAGCTATESAAVTVPTCTTLPTAYAVTGGGIYCINGLGKAVGLAGSEIGVNYQLYNDGDVRGTAVAGTGAAFNFPNQTDFGVYTVIATNPTTGCTAAMTGSVTMSPGVIPPAAVAGLATGCNTVSLTAYGGTSYAWSGGNSTATAANTFSASGIYTVTVSTADGCSTTATRAITVNPLPAAAIAMVNSCNVTTLTASGGTTYSWSGGSAPTAAVNTVSVSGTYNVTVTNATGCSATTSQVVTMPNVTEIVFGALSNCGSATLIANTIAGATYAWSGGATPNAVSNTVATSGIYTVTITSNGCSLSTTRSITVYPLPAPSITSANPTCNNGTSVLTATGGTAYTWSAGLATTSAVNTVNGSGVYTVTVSNGNGCSASSSITINAIPSPQIAGNTTACGSVSLTAYYGNTYAWSGGNTATLNTNTFTASGTYIVTATSTAGCTGTASIAVVVNTAPAATIAGSATGCGSASLTASGGGTYQWSGGFTPTSSTNTVSNATTYTVTVTGANGCTASSTFAVTAINTPVNPIITGNPKGCTSAVLTASGGNTYAWSGGNTPALNTNTFTTSGTYTVTITRTVGGCTATASSIVTIGGAVTPQIAVSNNATCTGLTLTASGGATYAWSGGGTAAAKTIATSGTYTVTATTAICGTGTASITVSTTVPTPAIAASATACGSATLTASGGASYSWSNNVITAINSVLNTGTYTVTITAANGCTASSTKAVTISNVFASISGLTTACNTTTLTASGGTSYAWSGGGTTAAKTITASGIYTVTATSGTCTATATKAVVINANPTVSMASSAISCGTATLTATPSPAGVYTYTWATGRNTSTTAVNTVAAGGTYNVTVTNANGCTASTNLLVTIPSASAGIAGVSAACGSVTLTAYSNGGTPTYAWSDGSTTAVKNITTSGTYTVTITTGSCTATASQTVTINPTVTATISASSTTACNTLNLTASGGTYYAWSGGTNPTAAVNTVITTSTYTVTVTNSAGCTASTTQAVTINLLPTAGITGVTTGCGQVLLTATGNTGSTYAWSGGASPSVAGNTFTSNGIYTVTVTQGVCGTATASRSVTINTPPTASITGNSSGVSTVTLTAAGGTYYAWNSGFTPTAAVNTAFIAGTYVVTVTDNNGCSATASKVIALTGLMASTNSGATTAQTLDTDKLGATAGLQDFVYNNVSVYPNPISTETLTVKISVSMNEVGARIDLVDLYGKLISTQNALLKRGDNTFELDVNGLAAGIYFVKTTAAGQSFETKKVVKVGN